MRPERYDHTPKKAVDLFRTAARDSTPAEADEIRRRLKGIRFGTPKYERIRDELGAKLGINRRQIYGAWRAWKALKRRKR